MSPAARPAGGAAHGILIQEKITAERLSTDRAFGSGMPGTARECDRGSARADRTPANPPDPFAGRPCRVRRSGWVDRSVTGLPPPWGSPASNRPPDPSGEGEPQCAEALTAAALRQACRRRNGLPPRRPTRALRDHGRRQAVSPVTAHVSVAEAAAAYTQYLGHPAFNGLRPGLVCGQGHRASGRWDGALPRRVCRAGLVGAARRDV